MSRKWGIDCLGLNFKILWPLQWHILMFSTFFFFFQLEGFYLHTYKCFTFFKKSSKTPTNNSTHFYILFNSVSSFNTLAAWEVPKLYFQRLKPEWGKMWTTCILKHIILWKSFFFHKIWVTKPMTSLPTQSSNGLGCFQHLFSTRF